MLKHIFFNILEDFFLRFIFGNLSKNPVNLSIFIEFFGNSRFTHARSPGLLSIARSEPPMPGRRAKFSRLPGCAGVNGSHEICFVIVSSS